MIRIVSVNVGWPRDVHWKGRIVTTSIFKEPVVGGVRMRRLNLDGDLQADLTVHGGPSKAVYVYPAEHYAWWQRELPEMTLPWGMFGENLTIRGLMEADVNIGDRFRIGSAEVMVTEPRMPCYKLGLKFGRDDIIKRFLVSGRTGFYLAVLAEGDVAVDDAIERLERDSHDVTVADISRLYRDRHDGLSEDLVRRALRVEALPEAWRRYLRQRLDRSATR